MSNTDSCPVPPSEKARWDSRVINDMKRKLDECDGHRCYHSVPELPTRLLDIESFDTLGRVRLVETKDKHGQVLPAFSSMPRYAALSYCWGRGPAFQTTTETIKDRKHGFDTCCLPLTICEAVKVTSDLGLRYLWVDALCIIQGRDPVAKADWNEESARMSLVYGGAYITLVASASSDSIGGLIGGRQTCPILKPRQAANHDTDPEVIAILTLDVADAPSRKEAISGQTWACQEWFLSSRLLVFTTTAVHFVCRENQLPKVDHASVNRRLPETKAEARRLWRTFVQNFAARNMSDPDDKLPAIAGLAQVFQKVGGDALGLYCAGLWEETLLHDLLWKRQESTDALSNHLPAVFQRGRCWIKPGDTADDRSTWKPRAPSWSWAAVDGQILCINNKGKSNENKPQCRVKLTDPNNPLGKVDSGTLTITCRYTMGSLVMREMGLEVEVNGASSGFWCDDPVEASELLATPGHSICLLAISVSESGIWEGIGVVADPSADGFYRRVGFFCLNRYITVPDNTSWEFRIN